MLCGIKAMMQRIFMRGLFPWGRISLKAWMPTDEVKAQRDVRFYRMSPDSLLTRLILRSFSWMQ